MQYHLFFGTDKFLFDNSRFCFSVCTMGAIDLWLKEIFTLYGSLLFAILVIVYVVNWWWSKLVKSVYRLHLIGFETECADISAAYKKRLFAPLSSTVSSDEILKSEGAIRVLEIGVKTGTKNYFYN